MEKRHLNAKFEGKESVSSVYTVSLLPRQSLLLTKPFVMMNQMIWNAWNGLALRIKCGRIGGRSDPAESTQHLTDAGEVINHPSPTLEGILVGLGRKCDLQPDPQLRWNILIAGGSTGLRYTRVAKEKNTPWLVSASELYRPSDHRLSAKLVPTLMDRGCHVVSVTDSYGSILGFLDRTRL
jgi:hypothetical protein